MGRTIQPLREECGHRIDDVWRGAEERAMKVREVVKLLEHDGWYIVRTRGSHRQYKHANKKGLVTVPEASMMTLRQER